MPKPKTGPSISDHLGAVAANVRSSTFYTKCTVLLEREDGKIDYAVIEVGEDHSEDVADTLSRLQKQMAKDD